MKVAYSFLMDKKDKKENYTRERTTVLVQKTQITVKVSPSKFNFKKLNTNKISFFSLNLVRFKWTANSLKSFNVFACLKLDSSS